MPDRSSARINVSENPPPRVKSGDDVERCRFCAMTCLHHLVLQHTAPDVLPKADTVFLLSRIRIFQPPVRSGRGWQLQWKNLMRLNRLGIFCNFRANS